MQAEDVAHWKSLDVQGSGSFLNNSTTKTQVQAQCGDMSLISATYPALKVFQIVYIQQGPWQHGPEILAPATPRQEEHKFQVIPGHKQDLS